MQSFNPRSRTGNDMIGFMSNRLSTMFQSTFPHGERQYLDRFLPNLYRVSIHVPARGTTAMQWIATEYTSRFQSTFPHGERPFRRNTLVIRPAFQSTFPHGERLSVSCPLCTSSCFNPRSRTGNDRNRSSRQ